METPVRVDRFGEEALSLDPSLKRGSRVYDMVHARAQARALPGLPRVTKDWACVARGQRPAAGGGRGLARIRVQQSLAAEVPFTGIVIFKQSRCYFSGQRFVCPALPPNRRPRRSRSRL